MHPLAREAEEDAVCQSINVYLKFNLLFAGVDVYYRTKNNNKVTGERAIEDENDHVESEEKRFYGLNIQ